MVGVASPSLVLSAQDASEVGLPLWRDEELRPDLTSRVDTLSQCEDSSVDGVLHGDDLALPVAECEVVVEEPLAELVGAHGLDGLRQDLAEGAGGEVSFCCFDGFAEGCDRALGFDFCFCLGSCGSFFLEGCRQLNDDVGVGDHVFDGGGCGVHAVLADGGEDFAGDPATECLGLGLVGSDDDFVEAGFVDDCELLGASRGVHRADTLHVWV